MADAAQRRRSILAILAGLVVIVVTSFGIQAANPLLMRMFPAALPDETAMSHNLPAWLFTFASPRLGAVD
jgi:hypothetical protein